jgi:hypothetical protein
VCGCSVPRVPRRAVLKPVLLLLLSVIRLLKDETVNHDVIVEVLGKRQFTTQVYSDYVANAHSDKIVAERKKESERKEAEKQEADKQASTPPTEAAPAPA